MSDAPVVRWQGDYIRAVQQGRWEYAERVNATGAVVIVAMAEGRFVLVEQPRAALGGRCLELPAGLVGDEDDKDVEATAIKELEEETGFTAERIERLGVFASSPGMTSECFTLVRAHGLTRVGRGGGVDHEEIVTHLVAPDELADFVAARRAAGVAIDVKLLLLLSGALIG